jgi:DNA invertase Pin-like site-specific DNA recombinase
MNTKDSYRTAHYARLSRDDGDKLESDSILNQQHLIEDYCAHHPELTFAGDYIDDGYTGTSFQRPGFQRLIADIEAGMIDCVVVKDLSRFGRDYIGVGHYLERYFPEKGVRFIAINDGVDSLKGPYDMLLPLRNVFNAQYAKDISTKVRSALRTKQHHGEFVGAFACYGYLKDPADRNHLIIDPVAAPVVLRIFQMAAQGIGQIRIAKNLNQESIPCPSEYKRLMGEKYTNSKRLESTRYWTYATIHRILQNPVYIGSMIAGRTVRPNMHSKAVSNPKENWIVVEHTHEAIISPALWETVQAQITQNSRVIDFDGNVSLFAGLLTCGDCGRAMCKTTWGNLVTYACGSYHRYGSTVCSSHYLRQDTLEAIVLEDINRILATITDLKALAQENTASSPTAINKDTEKRKLEAALARVQRLKKSTYEDYKDGLLTRDEFLRYKADYDHQEQTLQAQAAQAQASDPTDILENPWVDKLLALGHLTALDRPTLVQTVEKIRVFEDKHLEITYRFSEALRPLLEPDAESGI